MWIASCDRGALWCLRHGSTWSDPTCEWTRRSCCCWSSKAVSQRVAWAGHSIPPVWSTQSHWISHRRWTRSQTDYRPVGVLACAKLQSASVPLPTSLRGGSLLYISHPSLFNEWPRVLMSSILDECSCWTVWLPKSFGVRYMGRLTSWPCVPEFVICDLEALDILSRMVACIFLFLFICWEIVIMCRRRNRPKLPGNCDTWPCCRQCRVRLLMVDDSCYNLQQ